MIYIINIDNEWIVLLFHISYKLVTLRHFNFVVTVKFTYFCFLFSGFKMLPGLRNNYIFNCAFILYVTNIQCRCQPVNIMDKTGS